MNLAKNIITALLALLLVNPACCCAFGDCAASSEATPAGSCCSVSTDGDSDDNTPDKEHQCQCSLDNEYTEQSNIDVIAPAATPLPEPTFIELAEVSFEPAVVNVSNMSAPPPPSSPLRILFSVFRL